MLARRMAARTREPPASYRSFGENVIRRQMLHAESLSILHPDTGHPMTFTAPPPQDMAAVIERLRQMKSP